MSRRELIVSGPGADPRVAEQLRCVDADPAGAQERELVVTHREAPRFQVELLGKDGGVKARWEDRVGCEELWARIDAMPSRRRALLRRRAADGDAQATRSAPV
jgi:Domain of unknown function (DUF4174)